LRCAAFTLIEVLVVVAIIALLLAILLPSLSRAKEKARQAMCLSNLKQQGIGCAAYSAENRAFLPWAGHFRYVLAEGTFEVGAPGNRWTQVNNGALYPKYVGKTLEIFYCPSNVDADGDGYRGKEVFMKRYNYPEQVVGPQNTPHDPANDPIGAYTYALPVLAGKNPRDAGAQMYPRECMTDGPGSGSPFYNYMTDPAELTPDQAAEFLGPFPQPLRGKHGIQTLMTDAYFGGYQGYHLNGFNVLFSDMHATRIPDPRGIIIKGVGGGSRYSANTPGELWNRGKCFMVWDYFARNP
jgi:prepilin-type N-terminal cleavage/methylation domain-containing protein